MKLKNMKQIPAPRASRCRALPCKLSLCRIGLYGQIVAGIRSYSPRFDSSHTLKRFNIIGQLSRLHVAITGFPEVDRPCEFLPMSAQMTFGRLPYQLPSHLEMLQSYWSVSQIVCSTSRICFFFQKKVDVELPLDEKKVVKSFIEIG